jgi:uncharacterized protein DUF4440
MKWAFTASIVCIAMMVSSCSQAKLSNATSPQALPSENIEQTLMNLHAEWGKVPLSGDVSVLERLLAPDFVYIADDPEHLRNGSMMSKQEYIAYEARIGKETNTYTSAESRNMKVRVYGRDFAVSTGDFHVAGSDRNGNEFRRISRWMNIWVRRNGAWQAVAAQNTWTPAKS